MNKIFSRFASTLGFQHTGTAKQASSSVKSGRRTSIGSSSETAEKMENLPLLGPSPKSSSKKIGSATSFPKDSSTKKTTGCTGGLFKGLIDKYKAKKEQNRIKQQQTHHRNEIAKNPHSASLGATLGKFLGRVHVDMSKQTIQEKIGNDMQMSKLSSPTMTSKDSNNLNQYFAQESIDSGVDALVDLHKMNNQGDFMKKI